MRMATFAKPKNIVMKKAILIIMLLVGCPIFVAAQKVLSDKELRMLDKELSMVQQYDKQKFQRIDSLKLLSGSARTGSVEKMQLWIDVASEYETFVSDSSLLYYNKAAAMAEMRGDTLTLLRARLGRVKVLGVLGLFKEGVEELNEVESNPIPKELEEYHFDTGRQLYSYMASFVQSGQYYERYSQMLNYYRSEQLKLLDKKSPIYREFLAEHCYANGLVQKAKDLLTEIIDSVSVSSNVYARAAANMAIIKSAEGIDHESAYFLALSAISDIRSSVKENTALPKLALYLYERGDISHAYNYLSQSLADALFCNARLRTNEVSQLMPLIDGAYKVELDKKRNMLMVTTVVVSLLSIGMIVAILMILRQMRRLRQARKHLKEANSIKEEYIGHFLELCSIYMDRLDNFCKTVTRKITAGQTEELVKMTKSPKFAEEQHRQFYENFDGAFLHIYPTFIEEFNNLLQPGERIEVKEPGTLTTELRIFAFLRMGVDDSAKVASFLHYSVNTIYAYRNKVKNKAIDRDNFEENVKKIGSIS